MNISKAIEYPFSKVDWIKRFGITFLLYFVPIVILQVLSLLSNFGQIFTSEFSRGNRYSSFSDGAFLSLIPSLFMIAVVLFVVIPIAVYMSGYMVKVFKEIKEGKEELPKHDNFFETLGVGFKFMIVNLIYGLPIGLFYGVSLVAFISSLAFTIRAAEPSTSSILITLVLALVFLLFLLAIIAYGIFVLPAYYMEFIRNMSIGESLRLGNVLRNIKLGWKQFLTVFALNLVAGIIRVILSIIPCFGVLVNPFTATYSLYFSGYLYGSAFKEIDAKIKKS